MVSIDLLSLANLQEYAAHNCAVKPSDTIAVFNPSTDERLGTLPVVSHDDLNFFHTRTETAFNAWSRYSIFDRSTHLHSLADLMALHRDALATIISLENGKPFAESRGEVTYSIGFFRWFANSIVRLEGRILSSNSALMVLGGG